MPTRQPISPQRPAAIMETTDAMVRVAGVEVGRGPFGLVRVALEGEGGGLLLQLTEEAAMQLLAHLLEALPKRGLRK